MLVRQGTAMVRLGFCTPVSGALPIPASQATRRTGAASAAATVPPMMSRWLRPVGAGTPGMRIIPLRMCEGGITRPREPRAATCPLTALRLRTTRPLGLWATRRRRPATAAEEALRMKATGATTAPPRSLGTAAPPTRPAVGIPIARQAGAGGTCAGAFVLGWRRQRGGCRSLRFPLAWIYAHLAPVLHSDTVSYAADSHSAVVTLLFHSLCTLARLCIHSFQF
jgi:hypothetical protein